MKEIVTYFLIFYHYHFVQSIEQFAPSIVIFSLMNELNIKSPTIFDDNTIVNHHQKIKFVKEISKLGHAVSYNDHNTHPNIIFTHLDALPKKLDFCNQTTETLVITKTVLLRSTTLALLEILHDILRILGDLTRNRSSSKLKGAETAVRRHGIRLKWPPLGTHCLCTI